MVNKFLKSSVVLALLGVLSSANAEQVVATKQSAESVKNALSNQNNLILAVGAFDPKFDQLDFSNTGLSNLSLNNYGIVQFNDRKADFNWLQKKGFKVLQSLSHNAYVVDWRNSDKSLLDQNNNIRWYGAYQSGFKVSPDLWDSQRAGQSVYHLSVHSFKSVDESILRGLVKKYLPNEKIVSSNIPSGYNQIVIEVSGNRISQALNALSSLEDIQWVAPYYQETFFNTEAVSAIQATSASGGTSSNDTYRPSPTPIWDQGLWGTGQIVGIADSGLDRNEDWFVHLDKGSGVVSAITDAEDVDPPTVGTTHPNNKIFAYWTMPGAAAYDNGTFHGTHTTGSIAGDRANQVGSLTETPPASASSPSAHGYDNDDGMAPNAQILFNDIGSNSGLTGTGSTPMWQQAYAAGVFIHSNSYGSSSLGEYIGSDARADEALRELDDMIILFAAGNDDGQVNSVSSPGNAKNVVSVGALLHGNSTSVASFSNKGPTDDGRLKPDISATGSSIESAAGDTNNANVIDAPSRRTTSGTSMSTPITAGGTALLRQYFTDGFYPTGTANAGDAHKPSGTLMKAMLLNGTRTDGGFFTNQIGWGRVWLENTLYFDGDNRRFRFWEFTNENGLSTGEQFNVEVTVQAGEEFRATLVWYDVPGPTGSGVTLVNNLDLSVDAGGNTYLANNFSGNNSATGGSADSINSVEQIRFSAPATGTYTINVDATNIPGDGTFGSDKQGFALVVSGDLASGGAVPANPTDPTNLMVTSNTPSGISLAWSDVSADYSYYEIYRTEGSCTTADLTAMRFVGIRGTNNFTDDTTVGGYQYAYKVRAYSDDLVSSYTNCVDATSTQICSLQPSFESSSVLVGSNSGANCHVSLTWNAATSNCPAANDVKYNIYRNTSHNFTPAPGNLLTTTAANATGFIDNVNVTPNQVYYYIVKAEDTTADGSGPNGGNETGEVFEVVATALGLPGTEGSFTDDVDNLAVMRLGSVWSVSNEQSSNGLLSYRSAAEGSNTYTPNTCGRMHSQEFTIPASPSSTPNLTYQARYNIEADWDGVVVEISTDGGSNWTDLPPNGGYPNDFSSTGSPPINACGYIASQGAFNGSSAGFQSVTHDLSAYNGQTVQVRWSLSTDPGSEEEGFYLDELQYNNISVPQSCNTVGDLIFMNGFE